MQCLSHRGLSHRGLSHFGLPALAALCVITRISCWDSFFFFFPSVFPLFSLFVSLLFPFFLDFFFLPPPPPTGHEPKSSVSMLLP